MNKVTDAFNSPGWIGLVSNLLAVWILLAASIWLLSRTGSDFGATTATSPRDPPWTPSGAFIGAVWALLYTLMALSLWVPNRTAAAQGTSRKPGADSLVAWADHAHHMVDRGRGDGHTSLPRPSHRGRRWIADETPYSSGQRNTQESSERRRAACGALA